MVLCLSSFSVLISAVIFFCNVQAANFADTASLIVQPQISSYATFATYNEACENQHSKDLQKIFTDACEKLEQKKYNEAADGFKNAAAQGHTIAKYYLAHHVFTNEYPSRQQHAKMPHLFLTKKYNPFVHGAKADECFNYLNGNHYLSGQLLMAQLFSWKRDYAKANIQLWSALQVPEMNVYDAKLKHWVIAPYIHEPAYAQAYRECIQNGWFSAAYESLQRLCCINYYTWKEELSLFKVKESGEIEYRPRNTERSRNIRSIPMHPETEQSLKKAPGQEIAPKMVPGESSVGYDSKKQEQECFEQLRQSADYTRLRTFIEKISANNSQQALVYLLQLDQDTLCNKAGLGWQYLYCSALQKDGGRAADVLLQQCIVSLSTQKPIDNDIVLLHALDALDFSHPLRSNRDYINLLYKTFKQLGDQEKAQAYLTAARGLGDSRAQLLYCKEQNAHPITFAELWKQAKNEKKAESLDEIARHILNADYTAHSLSIDSLGIMITAYLQAAQHVKQFYIKQLPFDLTRNNIKKPLRKANELFKEVENAVKEGILQNPLDIRNLYYACGQYDKEFALTKTIFQETGVLDRGIINTLEPLQVIQILELMHGARALPHNMNSNEKQLMEKKVIELLANARHNSTIIVKHADILQKFVVHNKDNTKLLFEYITALHAVNKTVDQSIVQLIEAVDVQALGDFLLKEVKNENLIASCFQYINEQQLGLLCDNYKELFMNDSFFAQQPKVKLWEINKLYKQQQFRPLLKTATELKRNKQYASIVPDIEEIQKSVLSEYSTFTELFNYYTVLQNNNDDIWVTHFKDLHEQVLALDKEGCVEDIAQAYENTDISAWFAGLSFNKTEHHKVFEYSIEWALAISGHSLMSDKLFTMSIVPLFLLLPGWSNKEFNNEGFKKASSILASVILADGDIHKHRQEMDRAYTQLSNDPRYCLYRTTYLYKLVNDNKVTQLIEQEIKEKNYFIITDFLLEQFANQFFPNKEILFQRSLETVFGCLNQKTDIGERLLCASFIKNIIAHYKGTIPLSVTLDSLKNMPLKAEFERWEKAKQKEEPRVLWGNGILALLQDDKEGAKKYLTKISSDKGLDYAIALGMIANMHDNDFTKPVDDALVEQILLFFDEVKKIQRMPGGANMHRNFFETSFLRSCLKNSVALLFNVYRNFDQIPNKKELGQQLFKSTRYFVDNLSKESTLAEIESCIRITSYLQKLYESHQKMFVEELSISTDELATIVVTVINKLKQFKDDQFSSYAQLLYTAEFASVSPHLYDNSKDIGAKSLLVLSNIAIIKAYLQQMDKQQDSESNVPHIISIGKKQKHGLLQQLDAIIKQNETAQVCDAALEELHKNIHYYCRMIPEAQSNKNKTANDIIEFLLKEFPKKKQTVVIIKDIYLDDASCLHDDEQGNAFLEICKTRGNTHVCNRNSSLPSAGNEQSFIEYLSTQFKSVDQASTRKECKRISALAGKNEKLIADFSCALLQLKNKKNVQELVQQNDDGALNEILNKILKYVSSRTYVLDDSEYKLWNAIGEQSICGFLETLKLEPVSIKMQHKINFMLCFCYARFYQALKQKMEGELRNRGAWIPLSNQLAQVMNKFDQANNNLDPSPVHQYCGSLLRLTMKYIAGKEKQEELHAECVQLMQENKADFTFLTKNYTYIRNAMSTLQKQVTSSLLPTSLKKGAQQNLTAHRTPLNENVNKQTQK
ncbi:MAG: hypothetical protein WCE21_00635 [Candidatus Babeliales bacterium]